MSDTKDVSYRWYVVYTEVVREYPVMLHYTNIYPTVYVQGYTNNCPTVTVQNYFHTVCVQAGVTLCAWTSMSWKGNGKELLCRKQYLYELILISLNTENIYTYKTC